MKTYYGIVKDGELLRRSVNSAWTIRFYDRYSDAKRQCQKLNGDWVVSLNLWDSDAEGIGASANVTMRDEL
ncbi:hypothetical protein SEA_KEELAN_109 [Gordonia phage Keelan]|nr:hypothetical protein SEA_KEELAN_109 [Gordonia phage Keelan]